ncbi:hypothetical protein ACSQ67_000422 [Phaseolus vulgaris]
MNNKAPSFDDSNVDCNVSPNQYLRQQHGQQRLGRQARRRLTNRPYQENLMNMARGKERDCHFPEIPRGNHETRPMSINNSNNIIHCLSNLPFIQETPNFILPNQAFGFNLNLHSFNEFKTAPLLNNNTLDPTILLNNNTLNPTLLLNNNTLDPTLLLDNNMLDPTLVLDNNKLDPILVLNNNISRSYPCA